MELSGANPRAPMTGLERLPGKVNYFLGADPNRWRAGIPTYRRVRYAQVYPGIDLVFYGASRGAGQQLEYDFHVAPHADPRRIGLRFQGAENARIDRNGDLVLLTLAGEVRHRKPVLYQEDRFGRKAVEGSYALCAAASGTAGPGARTLSVGFRIGKYDPGRPLILDPKLEYSTILGGSSGDEGSAIAVDRDGFAYITGRTYSLDFPTKPVETAPPPSNAFVTKLTPDGASLVYSTYLGGSGDDGGTGIALGTSGDTYVVGSTASTDFPGVDSSSFQTALRGQSDAFLARLRADGTVLHSTYLGGSGEDTARGIAVDASGAYLGGVTDSADFPTTSGAFQPTTQNVGAGTLTDGFITKLDLNATRQIYSTFLSGDDLDEVRAIAIDPRGNAYTTGYTRSRQFFPTRNPFQSQLRGGPAAGDAFVSALNAAGSELIYSTYFGGNASLFPGVAQGDDEGNAIAVDPAGNAFITGRTTSTDLPVTPGAFQAMLADVGESARDVSAAGDAFVARFGPTGQRLYCTYYGLPGQDRGNGIAIDTGGDVYLAGESVSLGAASDDLDAFITVFLPTGSKVLYEAYLGGTSRDSATGVAVGPEQNAYLVGTTALEGSSPFPTTTALIPRGAVNAEGVFVARVSPRKPPRGKGRIRLTIPGKGSHSLRVTGASKSSGTTIRLSFGTVKVGANANRTLSFLISNVGTGPLEGAPQKTRYQVSKTKFGFVLLDPSVFYLLPGKSKEVRVDFRPQVRGSYSSKLVVSSNDPKHPKVSVQLNGKASGDPLPK
jgi:hypothetical protein